MLKAIIINNSRDETLRVLDAIVVDRIHIFEVSPSEIAHRLGTTESTVRYNVKKLVNLGYLSDEGPGSTKGRRRYKATEVVRFLQEKKKN